VFAQKCGKLIFFGMLLGPEGAVASSLGPKKVQATNFVFLNWDL
jgi:hypothetical protein